MMENQLLWYSGVTEMTVFHINDIKIFDIPTKRFTVQYPHL